MKYELKLLSMASLLFVSMVLVFLFGYPSGTIVIIIGAICMVGGLYVAIEGIANEIRK